MYVARLQQVPPVIALLVPNSTPSTIVNIVFSNIAFVYQESQFLLDYNYGLHYTPQDSYRSHAFIQAHDI